MDTGTIPDRIKRLQMLTSDALTRAHTLVASVCAAAAAGGHDWKQGRRMMKVSRSIRKECNSVILIAFAAAMLAVCTSSALASATYIPPNPTNLTNATGSDWVNYTWQAGSEGAGDLPDAGGNSTPAVFGMGNVTDSYNVSVNGTWHNGTTNTPINETVGSGEWVNITVWAWNASGTGTLSAGCVSDYVQTLPEGPGGTFGLVGSIPTGGGGGTYPPGWFETPTPTVAATKAPAASVTATATTAPAGEHVTPTPAPTKTKTAAAETTAPAAEGTTAGDAKKGVPGFTAVFVIAGMLAALYAVMRRRE
jgi:PGF-CTERM protein